MTSARDDPFDLRRFVEAQAKDYSRALNELRAGKKSTHWIWYILPQLRGLGTSSMANVYGIGGIDEARAYLAHPVLGSRLRECVAAINGLQGRSAVEVLGSVDAAKFRSCLTLFKAVDPEDILFSDAIALFFDGDLDQRTLDLIGTPRGQI